MDWERWKQGNGNQTPEMPKIDPAEVLEELGKKKREILALLGVVLALAVGTTSFYTVQPDERAVVLRFGQFVTTASPGLNFKLPLGIDRHVKVTTRVEQENFGFRAAPSAPGVGGVFSSASFDRSIDSRSPSEESLMLTGDLKVAEVRWSVQYQIADPRKFLFSASNPRKTIRDISIATMRQVVGDKGVYEVLTVGRERIATESRELTQTMLDEKYDMGVQIVAVNLQSVSPPGPVAPSFNDVNAAIQDKDQAINRAQADYNRIIPEAKGRGEQEILSSQGYAVEVLNRSKGDADRLKKIIAEYEKAPEVTQKRLYLEMAENIFGRMQSLTIIDPSLRGILPVFGDKQSAQNPAVVGEAARASLAAEGK
jgi:membrane protease subunit HflK